MNHSDVLINEVKPELLRWRGCVCTVYSVFPVTSLSPWGEANSSCHPTAGRVAGGTPPPPTWSSASAQVTARPGKGSRADGKGTAWLAVAEAPPQGRAVTPH